MIIFHKWHINSELKNEFYFSFITSRMEFNFRFKVFDAAIEEIESENKELYDKVKSIEEPLKKLVEDILIKIDTMFDDYREDHDNYDSLSRERRLRSMKFDACQQKEKINDLLDDAGYFIHLI